MVVFLGFCVVFLGSGQSTPPREGPAPTPYAVLDPAKILGRETFWENQDRDWFEANIPLLDTPSEEINTIFHYRFELVTRHLVYGSPANGYAFTEFMDRPFWSGRYGAISCPAGLQLAEVRWLRDPRYAWDYARYWVKVPGAQPRNYSTWLAAATLDLHRVHPDSREIGGLYPGLVDNFRGWEARHFVPEKGLFWQTGHDDGMEFNITSRQTKDILRGAPAYRPTINAYMWADMRALAGMARSIGNAPEAQKWEDRASQLRQKVLEQLWDPERSFFFPRFKNREEGLGAVVEPDTLTYRSGKFAGNPHGRELHGYVPWQFGLPGPAQKGAWKFLNDPAYFQADFGPTTVERRDPQFLLQKWCCWWSGQSWPYATSQTLAGLARHLREEKSAEIERGEWFKLFETYTKTHRKNGKPYIAEGANPFTGSWEGHDAPGHSEHYFHSSYADLAITGLVGVQPGDGNEVIIDPLAPAHWDFFACDGIPCKGHTLSVVWDKYGRHYGLFRGLAVLVDGKIVAKHKDLTKLRITIVPIERPKQASPANYACANDGGYFPRARASTIAAGSLLQKAFDGQYWYAPIPVNRWVGTSTDAKNPDWLSLDLGTEREIANARVYFLEEKGIAPPQRVTLEYRDHEGQPWEHLCIVNHPQGRRAAILSFPSTKKRHFRLVLAPRPGQAVGIAEWELWGPGEASYRAPTLPKGNLALRGPDQRYPRASASMTSPYDKVEEINDGVAQFDANPRNRWTSYTSKSQEDWLELDFGKPVTIGRLEIGLYDDRGGVQAPESMRVEAWIKDQWREVNSPRADPPKPAGGQWNEVRFDPTETPKIRVVFRHKGQSRSGVTEILAWRE